MNLIIPPEWATDEVSITSDHKALDHLAWLARKFKKKEGDYVQIK